MNITYEALKKGCLPASVIHAIMTNKYPQFGFEQSWNGDNFSFIASDARGTVSFTEKYAVGALRHDAGAFKRGVDASTLLEGFPEGAKATAEKETFQYLLTNENGVTAPSVSFAFYCDSEGIRVNGAEPDRISELYEILAPFASDVRSALRHWSIYYGLSLPQRIFALNLLTKKLKDPAKPIVLTKKHMIFFPGDTLCEECICSLGELGITVSDTEE